jgi:hypothetical protein
VVLKKQYLILINAGILLLAFLYSVFIIQLFYIMSQVRFKWLQSWTYKNILNAFVLPSFVECTLQLFLFFSFVFIALPVSCFTVVAAPVFDLVDEQGGGLANIKALLYDGGVGLFLIASTLVLLVALIGAAVMTRNKR